MAASKSRGHICFAGRFEFFNASTMPMSTGVIMRAPVNAPLDVDGFRMGGRFEGTAAWWNRNGAMVVEALGAVA